MGGPVRSELKIERKFLNFKSGGTRSDLAEDLGEKESGEKKKLGWEKVQEIGFKPMDPYIRSVIGSIYYREAETQPLKDRSEERRVGKEC